MNTSDRVMVVESTEDESDSEGRSLLRVKGRSLEIILLDRAAKNTMNGLEADPEWVFNSPPLTIARTMFNDICVAGKLSLNDKIPYIFTTNYGSTSTLPEPSTPKQHVVKPQPVYSAIKELADIYEFGFRLVRHLTLSQLHFNVYTGSDRTTRQTALAPVIFAADYDNLQNTKEFRSIADAKNVAIVFSNFGSVTVYGDNVPTDVSGFDRRVLVVEHTDVPDHSSASQSILMQKGWDELRKNRTFSGFEGELNRSSAYVYGTHYNLGDIVEMRNDDGVISYKRVTEQIFVHDAEGERTYPTLSIDSFLATNTWLSQLSTRIWSDFTTTEYWSTM